MESWRYCPKDSNPADVPLRGMNSSQLAENTLWVMCPEWLSQHEEESKSIVVTEHIPEECLTEMTVKKSKEPLQKSLQQNKKFENWRREFNLFN